MGRGQVAAHFKRGAAGSKPNKLGSVMLTAQQEAAVTAQQDLTSATPAAIVEMASFARECRNPEPGHKLFGEATASGVLMLALTATASPANLNDLARTMLKNATTDSLYLLRALLEQVGTGTLQSAAHQVVIRFSFSDVAAATTLENNINTSGRVTGTDGVSVVSFARDGARACRATGHEHRPSAPLSKAHAR
jgi:hypothetical protein